MDDEAEELARDTLAYAYRAVDRIGRRQPRVWLPTVLREATDDRLRRAASPRDDGPGADGGRSAVGTPASSPGTLLVGEDFDDVVDEAVAAVPVKYRRAVRLVDVDGLSYAEAAGLSGVSEGTVMSRPRRARRRIRPTAAGPVPGRGGR